VWARPEGGRGAEFGTRFRNGSGANGAFPRSARSSVRLPFRGYGRSFSSSLNEVLASQGHQPIPAKRNDDWSDLRCRGFADPCPPRRFHPIGTMPRASDRDWLDLGPRRIGRICFRSSHGRRADRNCGGSEHVMIRRRRPVLRAATMAGGAAIAYHAGKTSGANANQGDAQAAGDTAVQEVAPAPPPRSPPRAGRPRTRSRS
jgi:hypothetical protein